MTPENPHLEISVRAPGCQQMSVNTLLCDTLRLAENSSIAISRWGDTNEETRHVRLSIKTCTVSSPIRDTPSYRAMPFRDSITEKGIAHGLPCFHRVYPFCGGVLHLHFVCSRRGEMLRKGGRDIAPNWPC